jgi:hypothetical protein
VKRKVGAGGVLVATLMLASPALRLLTVLVIAVVVAIAAVGLVGWLFSCWLERL